ncbi:hypothetical protein [Streptomyces sp. NPDC054863]
MEKLTWDLWAGSTHHGYTSYDGKLPLVVTSFNSLREHGPARQIFHRLERDGFQTLHDAIGNPRRTAARIHQRETPRQRPPHGRAPRCRKPGLYGGERRSAAGPAARLVGSSGAGCPGRGFQWLLSFRS